MARGGVSQSSAPPERRRVLLIVNLWARRGAHVQADAVETFSELKTECEVVVTTAPRHATEVVRERGSGFNAVFTLGGDGTAMEVITGLAGHGPPVGILPGGTGNVLVRSLGISLNVSRAVRQLLAGDERQLDLGQMADGQLFAIGLGSGLDEAMIAAASPYMKKRFGVIAYVWSATQAAFRLEQFDVKLLVDGVVHERRAASVLIANLGAVLGGAITLGEGITPDDGLLHACVYSPRNLIDVVRLFARMLLGTAHRDRCTYCIAGRHFRLETMPPRRVQADGELVGMTPMDVHVVPLAARLLIPRKRSLA
jgi:diacylglycerol kinase (ATP)